MFSWEGRHDGWLVKGEVEDEVEYEYE